MVLLKALNISKVYGDAASPVSVLKELHFELHEGELVGIYGASGAGKSTLLHILGGLDRPTSGEVVAGGKALGVMNEEDLASFRNTSIGFVFQFYHLLAEFTALENALLPALIAGLSFEEAGARAGEALASVGLSGRASHRPSMLSGGEQQRVALARASVMKPSIILADEPTGNLDRATGEQIFQYLLALNRKEGMAIAMVTHNQELLSRLPRVLELKEGRLQEYSRSRS